MATYGYARCSTNETKQDINRQIKELKAHGAEVVFQEFEHGDSQSKAQLEALFAAFKPGDTLVTLEVSRLSRSTRQLCDIIEAVKEKAIRLEIVDSITVDCRNGQLDPMTEAFLKMAGVFSELERKMICERVKSGVANARSKGKRIGRPEVTAEKIPPIFLQYYPRYKKGELKTKAELAKLAGLSRPTVNKYLSLLGDAQSGK